MNIPAINYGGKIKMQRLYYILKPFMSRKLQLFLRRKRINFKLKKYRDVWPVLSSSAKPPENWKGWPDNKKFAVILTHDVEHQIGYNRVLQLMDLEKELGFVSSFNFVPERDYKVEKNLLKTINENGFEYGVHGLHHDGKLFQNRKTFLESAEKINSYIKDWGAVGFRAPSMIRNLGWIGDLDIEYDLSTFDTDPFEPQPSGAGTIFPFWINRVNGRPPYLEMPYTLVQDFTLFVLMKETTPKIWEEKLEWIAGNGGMVLLNTHPDYMCFDDFSKPPLEEYNVTYFKEFLEFIRKNYSGQYWNVIPKQMAEYFKKEYKYKVDNV